MSPFETKIKTDIPNFQHLFCPSAMGFQQRDGFRQPYSNFSKRRYPLAQKRGTILMGMAVWRVTEKPKIAIFVRNIVRHARNVRNVRNVRNISGPWEHCSGTTRPLGPVTLLRIRQRRSKIDCLVGVRRWRHENGVHQGNIQCFAPNIRLKACQHHPRMRFLLT